MSEVLPWLILSAPALPLLVAALVMFPPLRPLLPPLAIVAPLPALAVALIAPEARVGLPWLVLGGSLQLDMVGRTFLLLFACLWVLAAWHAFFYLHKDEGRTSFSLWFLLAMAGNIGVVLAGDALTFYAYFSLMSFAAYGLMVHDRKPESLAAGRVYLVLVVIGELALFAGIMLAVSKVGPSFAALAASPVSPAAAALLGTGFAIKAGLMPLHFWLPLAHPAAPAPASAVLSGAMIKVGLLGALRFFPGTPLASAGEMLIWLGGASALLGVLFGAAQTNPKALLAYSSISQMGLIAIGLGAAWKTGEPLLAQAAIAATLLFAVHHGFAKAALFLGTAAAPGALDRGPRILRRIALLIPAAALAGAPLTSGAAAKGALKGMEAANAGLDLFLALSSAATTLLMLRFLVLMWRRGGAEKPGTLAPWLTCVALSAILLWFWPPAAQWVDYAVAGDALLASLWPVLLGILIGGLAARLLGGTSVAVPPGDLLMLLPTVRLPLSEPRKWDPAQLRATFEAMRFRALGVETAMHRWAAGAAATLLIAATLLFLVT